MNFLIYFCIPLVVTGSPGPGTYGDRSDIPPDFYNPETSETEAYSKYAYGSSVLYKQSSPLDEFAVDHQGTYYRKPSIIDDGAIGKPSIYNAPSGGSDQHPSFIASNIYARLKEKATKPNKSNPETVVSASPSPVEYGAPAPALLHRPTILKSAGPVDTPIAPLVPFASQPQFIQDPTTGQLFHTSAAASIYHNGLVPIYQTPAAYQPTAGALVSHHVPVTQQVIQPFYSAAAAPLTASAPLVHAPVYKTAAPFFQTPVYKTAFTPFLKTAPGVEATIVPAVEEPVPIFAKTHAPLLPAYQPYFSRFAPSNALLLGPKTPKVLLQKSIFKAPLSPILAEKAVLKAALTPFYKSPAHHHHYHEKAIVKSPLVSHYVNSGYIDPELPAKILHSQKAVVKSLISQDTGKVHYGKGVVGLPPGTTVELVPSLSYGFSYSLYPKPNGLYGPPLPLGHLQYAHHHAHGHPLEYSDAHLHHGPHPQDLHNDHHHEVHHHDDDVHHGPHYDPHHQGAHPH